MTAPAFWDWALQAYARPGVAEDCLALQDVYGQSVPFLLWAAWAASNGREPSEAALAEGAALAQRWDAIAIGPLRQVRRALKPSDPEIGDLAHEAFRAEVKAAELKAEQLLMQALEALARARTGAACAGPVLVRAAAAWGGTAPRGLLLDLMARLA